MDVAEDRLKDYVLGDVKTYLTIALIFAAFATAVVLAFALVYTAAAVHVSPLAGVAGIFVALSLLDVYIIYYIVKMYRAASSGDVAALKTRNSLGWAVLALLFAGVVPGIMLILAHGSVERLKWEARPPR